MALLQLRRAKSASEGKQEGADLIGYVDKTCDMAQCNAVFDSGAACGSIDAPHGGKHTYLT